MRLVVSFCLALLVGCANLHSSCIRAAQAELRALDAQIAESETARQRGYRVTQATQSRTTLNICAWPREPVLFCTTHTPGKRATRTEVSPAAEAERLMQLRREHARLVAVTADRIASCPA